ncbi:FUSC family protein [Thioclava kandeliae]|uniref:FUSC family protein n=1 Tax=Thioclava kandeliae TaxID=3070818 RepID=A0ABV1SE74_9RHOB
MIAGGIQVHHVIFSVKAFIAGMLAYLIADYFGLTNPYWALGSAYIVTNPLSGSVASKAVYRLGGTVLGAGAVIVLVPSFVQEPVLLVMAITLWAAICLFVSSLDRTPRAYVFMLAGYTAALTGFSIVSTPEISFTYGTSRMIEIGIGILCASVVGRLILPQALAPVLSGKVEGWLSNAADLTREVLSGEADAARTQAERNRLAADATGMRMLGAQVAYEGAQARAAVERLQAIKYRMVMILPQLSELADLRTALGQSARGREAGRAIIAPVQDWLDMEDAQALAAVDRLLSRLAQTGAAVLADDSEALRALWEGAPAGALGTWEALLVTRLAERLSDLVCIWNDCRILRSDLAHSEGPALRQSLSSRYRRSDHLHFDYGTSVLAVVTMMVAAGIAAAIWIGTGWHYGAGMLEFAIIMCSFMAAMDNSVPVMKKVLQLTLIALGLAFVYQFAILPAIGGGFAAEAAALAFVLIPCGILMASPPTWFAGFQVSVNLIYMLTLSNQIGTDLVSFTNASLGTVAGLIVAATVTSVFRAIGAERAARRIARAGWSVVIDAASGRRNFERERLYGRMLDRLGQIVPRLGALPEGSRVRGNDILRDLRVSLTVMQIQRAKAALAPVARMRTEEVLARIAALYRARRRHQEGAPDDLRRALDMALAAVPLSDRPLCDALAGLRCTLFAAAPPPGLDPLYRPSFDRRTDDERIPA